MNVEKYWQDILRQDADAIRSYFSPQAWINWHNTNERFTVEEFIRANCEYPGEWGGEIQKRIVSQDHIVTATRVYSKDEQLRFHVTSFFQIQAGKILSIDEYWGEDGEAPKWRKDLHIGSRIT